MDQDQSAHRKVIGPFLVRMGEDETLVVLHNKKEHRHERGKQDMPEMDSTRPSRNAEVAIG